MANKWYQPSFGTLRRVAADRAARRTLLQLRMLHAMQWGRDFDDTFRTRLLPLLRRYPYLHLDRYTPFRAWYRYWRGPRWDSSDPYYHPDAPDWELYAITDDDARDEYRGPYFTGGSSYDFSGNG